ncbi:hypothetical protein QUA86_29420 [Microcoleus sp. F6_B6]
MSVGRRKKEEGRRKKEEGRRKKEEGRRKKEDFSHPPLSHSPLLPIFPSSPLPLPHFSTLP